MRTYFGSQPEARLRSIRPLLGAAVVVRTLAATWRGTLLSCVKDSAWLVVDDVDVMVRLDDIIAITASGRASPPDTAIASAEASPADAVQNATNKRR